MTLGGILEFVLGNTFAFVVFCSYGKSSRSRRASSLALVDWSNMAVGAYWFTEGITLTPFYGAYAAYASDATNPMEGFNSEGFHATYGKWILLGSFMDIGFADRHRA